MSQPTHPSRDDDDQGNTEAGDALRRHAEATAEGGDATESDGAGGDGPDVPREHSEDPAEG